MALSIKDHEADRLIRELAAATGESITTAARVAFAERLERVRARASIEADRRAVAAIMATAGSRARHDPRTADEIVGYDEHGAPA